MLEERAKVVELLAGLGWFRVGSITSDREPHSRTPGSKRDY